MKIKCHRLMLRSSAIAGAAALLLTAGHAAAQANGRRFDIPQSQLARALHDFAAASGQQIIFSDAIVKGRRSAAVRGVYTPDAALGALLKGSGLRFERTRSNVIMIRPAASVSVPSQPQPQDSGSQAAPQAPAADPAPESAALADDEIVVTAQKRTENINEVPIAVSALGGERLEQLHATSLHDYAAYIPGLVVEGAGTPGQTAITIRGVSNLGGGTSTVAVYVDESPIGSSMGWAREAAMSLDLMPYDLERVEVLRGPQGTLYGANSLSGLLKYVTKNPDLDEFEGRIGGELLTIKGGDDIGIAGRAAISVPLLPGKLAVRASVYGQRTPGYIDNAVTGEEDQNEIVQHGGRLALLWEATPDLSVRLQAITQSIEADGNAQVRLGPDRKPLYGDLTFDNEVPESFYKRVNLFSGTVNWDIGFANLLSATSYSTVRSTADSDFTQSFGAPGIIVTPFFQTVRINRFTQELRLASPTGQRLEWMIGGYYSDEESRLTQEVVGFFAGTETPVPGANPAFRGAVPATYEEIAGFANARFNFTDRFDVSGGIRVARNRQTYLQIVDVEGFPTDIVPGSSEETVVTYSINPRFRINDDVMIYGQVSTGYRPGGPNSALPGVPPQVDADHTTNYELGIKAAFANRRGSVNLAVYRIDWDDIQLTAVNPDLISYDLNGGTARINGVELSSEFAPVEGLRLGFNAAYTDAELTEDVDLAPVLFWEAGSRLPTTPRWTTSITAAYERPLSEDWKGRVNAGWRYVGKRRNGIENVLPGNTDVPPLTLPSYNALDVSLGVVSDRFEISLYARNLLDKRAYVSENSFVNAFGQDLGLGVLLQPRTIGLSVDARF